MSLANTSLPKPKIWQDFESLTRELFACVLNDPHTQKNGRSGQKQSGVDVYGYRSVDYLVGVQCKEKFKRKITDDELRAEVTKSKTFKPQISEFILVTTAPRDQKIQECARLITEKMAYADHPIFVAVWGWEDIEEHAWKYPKAWKAFDPTWTSFVEQGIEALTVEVQEVKQSIERLAGGTRFPATNPTDVSLDGNNENTRRHGQITAFQRLIDEGHVQPALGQLLKLRSDEWVEASRSERYRILVGIASAKLRLGDEEIGRASCRERV